MRTHLDDILGELASKMAKYWPPGKTEEYLVRQGITRDAMLDLLARLCDVDLSCWAFFIGHELPAVASTEPRFLDLLERIAARVDNDIGVIGELGGALMKVGSKDPELGLALSKEMIRRNTDSVFFCGFLLGSAGRANFDRIFAAIGDAFHDANPRIRAMSVDALRIIFEDKTMELTEPLEVFRLLDKASNDENSMVLSAAARAYVSLNWFDPEESTNHLTRLAAKGNSLVRFALVDSLRQHDLLDVNDMIRILKICAHDNNKNILEIISHLLEVKGGSCPEDILEIMREWIRRDAYQDIRGTDSCLQQIGKLHFATCFRVVESWIEKEDSLFRYFIPQVLKEMSSRNVPLLIESLAVWIEKGRIFEEMTLKTVREVVNTILPVKPEIPLRVKDPGWLHSCYLLLENVARKRDFDIQAIVRNETEEVSRLLKLLRELESRTLESDYSNIFRNLASFPAIEAFLGQKWFENMRLQNNRTHPLLIMLSYEDLGKKDPVGTQTLLRHIEAVISTVKSKKNKLSNLRKGLGNPDQFWPTLSEIEIIASFLRSGDVEISPSIGEGQLDAKVEIDGNEFLIEVTSPDMFEPMKYIFGKVIQVQQRASDQIYDEFKDHLINVDSRKDVPIIIALDISRSELKCIEVEDYLMGSSQLSIIVDKKTGAPIMRYHSRKDDSMHARDQRTDVVSGVLCYRRHTGQDGSVRLEGRLIPNPYTKKPLGQKEIRRMEQIMFGERAKN